MCKFCDALTDKTKEIEWLVRSTYADDNICKVVNNQNCGMCDDCEMRFLLSRHEYKDDLYVGVEYSQVINKGNENQAIIRPFSETIQWNYCPICGKQLSKNIRESDEYYKSVICINKIEEEI